jgi:ribosome biogenesis GTPase
MDNDSFEIPLWVHEASAANMERGASEAEHAATSAVFGRVMRVANRQVHVRSVSGSAWLPWVLSEAAPPVAGDWVQIDEGGRVVAVVPRRNQLARRAAGARDEAQIIAANVDTVWIVTTPGADFSVRRIERYLTLAYEAGVGAAVLLTKASSCPDPDAYLAEVRAVAANVPVHAIDVLEGIHADVPASLLLPGTTTVLVGSSGVGKSTLLNHLLPAVQSPVATQPVREQDDKGRHTTTWRELRYLPQGAAVIDTPGVREVQLWASSAALAVTFADVALRADQCRYRDCTHDREPGCAVREAVERGELDLARVRSFGRLSQEVSARSVVERRAQRTWLKRKRGED